MILQLYTMYTFTKPYNNPDRQREIFNIYSISVEVDSGRGISTEPPKAKSRFFLSHYPPKLK